MARGRGGRDRLPPHVPPRPARGTDAESPALLAAVTYGWLALLVASPLLVAAAGRVRAALAGILVAAHLSMAFTLQIGVFPVVSATALLPFCPPFVWDRIESLAAPEIGRFRSMAERLLRSLRSTRPGSTLVDLASKIVPDRATRERLVAVIAALLLVSLLAWTAMGVGVVDAPEPVVAVSDPAESDWDMFAPEPPSTDALVLATATTADGDRTDALHGDPVATDRTPSDARDIPPPAGGSTSRCCRPTIPIASTRRSRTSVTAQRDFPARRRRR